MRQSVGVYDYFNFCEVFTNCLVLLEPKFSIFILKGNVLTEFYFHIQIIVYTEHLFLFYRQI